MKSLIEREAEADLEAAVAYYDQQRLNLSRDFLMEFEAALEQMEQFPQLAREDRTGHRHATLRRFPFQVVYRIDGNLVRVMAVIHKRREPGFWRSRVKPG